MPPDAPLGRLIGELIALPFVLMRDIFRLAARWRAVPLPTKMRIRATGGIFALVACVVFAAHGCPIIGPEPTAGIAALALLYLVVGTVGSRGATIDVMAVLWRCVVVIASAGLLVYAKIEGW